MNKILIFAGTVEGRSLAEYLNRHGIAAHVCVATEYGESLLPEGDTLKITSGRLNASEMAELIRREKITLVIDATHPYAVVVSRHIRQATEETGTECWRVLRKNSVLDKKTCIYVESVQEAAEYLEKTAGNVLLTTGSKELSLYTRISGYRERLYARVLSTHEVVQECNRLGFEGKNLICMQGPFGEELNYATLKQIDARYLVTKESGSAGGMQEKLNAARRAGAAVIVIGRPEETEGISYETCVAGLSERLQIMSPPAITLLGIGMGDYENMTLEGIKACEKADVLIGAGRILRTLERFQKPVYSSYKPEEILSYISQHPEYKSIVIALSGDSGFYSGAKKLTETLKQYKIKVLPGISSAAYLCSRLQISWEDVTFVSSHGREENVIAAVKIHSKVFALLAGSGGVGQLCETLLAYGLEDTIIAVGEHLSYENETIRQGTPAQLKEESYGELCSALILNPKAKNAVVTHGLPDEAFIRGQVPMTKEEVRSISISKMKLTRESVIYDIGAGTGSLGIEMALQAVNGYVYAIERNPDAVDLIEQNKRKLGAENLLVVHGTAPDAMEQLPVPSHAFIGGSHGNLKEIVSGLRGKNPDIRIVINAITLETVAEAMECLKEMKLNDADVVQVQISRSKKLGPYHMMFGQNPVYVIAFGGGSQDETA